MDNSKKAYKNPIRAAIAALLIGMVMRILHWPFSKGIIFISFAAILVLYALRFMKKEEKNLDEIEKLSSFDVTGRKPNATGGRVSLSAGGLAGMLGE